MDLFSSLTTSAVRAQEPGDTGLEIVELSGSLEMILGNQIKMKTQDGQEVVVLVGDDTEFAYTGTAEPTALSPGLMVRFIAPFDAAGMPQAPLTELEVFRPARARRMTPEMRMKQTPGVYPATEMDQDADPRSKAAATPRAAAQTAANPRTAKNRPAPQVPRDRLNNRNAAQANQAAANVVPTGNVQDYLVVGRLQAIQGDRLQVFAGNVPVIVQAAADLEIKVTAGDPLFCQAGDEIQLNGLKNPSGVIQGKEIEVTGAKPLGSVDEKDQVRNSRAAKRGKVAAEDPSDDTKATNNDKSKPR